MSPEEKGKESADPVFFCSRCWTCLFLWRLSLVCSFLAAAAALMYYRYRAPCSLLTLCQATYKILLQLPDGWRQQQRLQARFRVLAGTALRWLAHDGVGMLVYFSLSFLFDMAQIFGASASVLFCDTDKLVALYSAAIVTFLPNVVYARSVCTTAWKPVHGKRAPSLRAQRC